MAKRKDKARPAVHVRVVNRRALHDYRISENVEVGIELWGSEVKSIRAGKVSLAEGFARVEPHSMELYLHNVDIAHYPHAGIGQHEPKQRRKLLAHKRQIRHLHAATMSKGATLVPLSMYFVRGRVKLELGVGVGKRAYDKRQALKQREADREIRRGLTRKVI